MGRRVRIRVAAFLIFIVGIAGATNADNDTVRLYLFWQEGCPVCERMKPFLEELADRSPGLELIGEEVGYTLTSIRSLQQAAEKFGIDTPNVPAVFLGERAWIGYSEAITAEISRAVVECLEGGCIDAMADQLPPHPALSAGNTVDSRLFGTVELTTLPLTISTALIALLDGINPCSLWVLTFLLGMVMHTGSRGKVILVGTVFLTTTSVVYGLFIVGVVQVMSILAAARWIRYAVAFLALAMGAVNVKDFFAFKRGASLTISEKNQRRIGARARNLIRADRSNLSLAVSTAFLAAGVTIVELPCTAGFPVVWSNLLSTYQVIFPVFLSLLLLYLVVYLVDEIIIVVAAAFTLKRVAMNENRGRHLKLVGGVVMIMLAGVMVVSPELMESLMSVVGIFAGSAVIVVIVIAIDRSVRRRNVPVRESDKRSDR